MDGDTPKRKIHGGLILKLAIFCLTAVVVLSLVEPQVQLVELQEQLRVLQGQLEQQAMRNKELRAAMDGEEGLRSYAEKRAREDLDYVRPNERVFVDGGE